MKTSSIFAVLLALSTVVFAALWLSAKSKPPVEVTKEMWHTNTVELWRTNSVDRWCTNVVDATPVTNTIVQTVTNQIIREVTGSLSDRDRQAAAFGYRYLNAPTLADPSDTFYKANPLAVEVHLDPSAANIYAGDLINVRRTMERALRAQDVPVADQSPYHLSLNIAGVWTTDTPSVVILIYRLDLKETIYLQRQNDVIKFTGVVWSTTKSILTRSFNMDDQVRTSVQQIADDFSKEFLKAKAREKEVESRMPAVPRELAMITR